MTMKLTPVEAAQFASKGHGLEGSSASGGSFRPDPLPKVWSVNEKKFTRYLRKRKERPLEDPRLIPVEQKFAGALFGKNRERIKKVEEKFEVKIEVDENGPPVGASKTSSPLESPGDDLQPKGSMIYLRISGGSELDIPVIAQEFTYAEESVKIDSDPLYQFCAQNTAVLRDISRSTRANVTLQKAGKKQDIFASSSSSPSPSPSPGSTTSITASEVRVRGPRPSVNLALDALSTHFLYFKLHRDMAQCNAELAACKQALMAATQMA
ncbi:unnamed protein product [Amoebophrya sp. A25]|nr:unnamed protein product [Amoebophrya sp. A25]|eukprot:GSA25T00002387001.1